MKVILRSRYYKAHKPGEPGYLGGYEDVVVDMHTIPRRDEYITMEGRETFGDLTEFKCGTPTYVMAYTGLLDHVLIKNIAEPYVSMGW